MASDDKYIKFTPISGAKSEDALCYLLEIDDAKILLDCGWSDKFDINDLAHLKKVAKQIDVVLLSHSNLAHLGAIPYAYSKLGLTCPIYATTPVLQMGKLCMYDIYLSKSSEVDFTTFSLDDIDSAFNNCKGLKYRQLEHLKDKCEGITIMAYEAAHTLGGAVWNISQDTDNIVYAVDVNHRKEYHLNGSPLFSGTLNSLDRPSILVSGVLNADLALPRMTDRIKSMFDTISSSLQNGQSVLMPSDSTARVLELAYRLEDQWSKQKIKYPLIMLTNMSYHTMRYAKTSVEWMSEEMTKALTDTTTPKHANSFELNHMRLCHTLEDLEKYPGPKVVVTSNSSLDTGFARDLLLRWMDAPERPSTLILTDRSQPNTLARELYDQWDQRTAAMQAADGSARQSTSKAHVKGSIDFSMDVQLTISGRVALEGEELHVFEVERQAKAERDAAAAAKAARDARMADESDSDDSDMEGVDDSVEVMLMDRYVRDVGPSGGFFSQEKSYPMFPHLERRKRIDDYGEAIQVDHYKAESDRKNDRAQKEEDEEEDEEMKMANDLRKRDKLPVKYVSNDRQVAIRCRLQFVDLQGLADGETIKNTLLRMKPRKLILIHGTEKATEHISKKCLSLGLNTQDVFVPSVGDVLNVSATTNAYRVRLTDALMASLKFSDWKDYKLARVSGRIHVPEDLSMASLDTDAQGEAAKWDPSVYVGDIRLDEFKEVLQNEGIVAEFKGKGVLVCNGQIAVRKTGAGQLMVEGLLSPDYYKVRTLLYKQHAVL